MFQANHIAESLNCKTGKEEVFEFPCSIQRGRIINDMVVNMGFVDVGRNDESVFALCPSFDLTDSIITLFYENANITGNAFMWML